MYYPQKHKVIRCRKLSYLKAKIVGDARGVIAD